jgi:hypothetical protein
LEKVRMKFPAQFVEPAIEILAVDLKAPGQAHDLEIILSRAEGLDLGAVFAERVAGGFAFAVPAEVFGGAWRRRCGLSQLLSPRVHTDGIFEGGFLPNAPETAQKVRAFPGTADCPFSERPPCFLMRLA